MKPQNVTVIQPDDRSPERRALDEAIAAEPPLPPPEWSPSTPTAPMEARLAALKAKHAADAEQIEQSP